MRHVLILLSGPFIALAGFLIAIKGAIVELSESDPSLIPPSTLLFALGLAGFQAALTDRGVGFGRIGALLIYATLAASVVNLLGLALSIPVPGDPAAPAVLRLTYLVAFLGVLIGLLVLGIVTLRSGVLPRGWSTAPLVVGVSWFPLIGITYSLGEGMVASGFSWMFLGYALWRNRAILSGATPTRTRPRTS